MNSFSDEYQINFDYNLLKPLSIDEFIKICPENKKEKISLLFLEEMNKFIYYNKDEIISFNILNFKKEN